MYLIHFSQCLGKLAAHYFIQRKLFLVCRSKVTWVYYLLGWLSCIYLTYSMYIVHIIHYILIWKLRRPATCWVFCWQNCPSCGVHPAIHWIPNGVTWGEYHYSHFSPWYHYKLHSALAAIQILHSENHQLSFCKGQLPT